MKWNYSAHLVSVANETWKFSKTIISMTIHSHLLCISKKKIKIAKYRKWLRILVFTKPKSNILKCVSNAIIFLCLTFKLSFISQKIIFINSRVNKFLIKILIFQSRRTFYSFSTKYLRKIDFNWKILNRIYRMHAEYMVPVIS